MIKTSRLTPVSIEKAKPRKADFWLSDDEGTRGGGRLAIRIGPSGSKLFYFRYSIGGVRKQIPIGPFTLIPMQGRLTLEQAREEFRRYSALHRAHESQDVAVHLQKLKDDERAAEDARTAELERLHQEALAASKYTVLALCKRYSKHLRDVGKSSADWDSKIKCHIEDTEWAGIPARALTTKEAARLIRTVVDKGVMRTAGLVRSNLHAAYNLAVFAESSPSTPLDFQDFQVTYNPVSGVKPLTEYNVAGTRHLSERELGHFWHHLWSLPANSTPLSIHALRLAMLLGGQRGEQLLRAQITDIDLDDGAITLLDPKGRRTTPRVHYLPLTPKALAEALLLSERCRAMGSTYLFVSAETPRRSKKEAEAPREQPVLLNLSTMSKHVADISKKFLLEKISVSPFTFRDLRRTAETRMAALRIEPHIRAQIQSHGISGVQAKHYDMHEYLEEKSETLTMLGNHLDELAKKRNEAPQAMRLRRVA